MHTVIFTTIKQLRVCDISNAKRNCLYWTQLLIQIYPSVSDRRYIRMHREKPNIRIFCNIFGEVNFTLSFSFICVTKVRKAPQREKIYTFSFFVSSNLLTCFRLSKFYYFSFYQYMIVSHCKFTIFLLWVGTPPSPEEIKILRSFIMNLFCDF